VRAARRKPAASLRGSKKAKQIAVAVLETLAGELGTSEAAAQLGISLSRYYQLEARALEGLLQAVEPRAKGPQPTPERALRALQAEKQGLEKELRRHQALRRTGASACRRNRHPRRRASARSGARVGRRCCRRSAATRRARREETMARKSNLKTLVAQVAASPQARERAQVVLETLARRYSVQAGCARLGIRRTHFQDQRRRLLEAAVRALEERPVGRPRIRVQQTCRQLATLRRRLATLELELRRTEAELAIARSDAGAAVTARLTAKGGRR